MAGKIVVIAGASTGVGRAAAVRLATDGATVVLLARRKVLLDELAAEIGPSARAIATDLTDSDAVRSAFAQVAAEFGHIDALVNCAGTARIKAIEEATDEDITDSVGTNLIGPIYTTRSAIPLLRAAGGGDLINISSEITLDQMPLMTLYTTSKHGLNGFTAAMTRELRKDAIRVTLVILGAVGDTGFYDGFGAGALEKALPIWEADGYLTRMSGSHQLLSATVADVLHYIVTRPPELMLDVVHVRPALTAG
jgi:NAD(P)-dependent dehydrogenase (short-subunit alcohol dehydrogenase family)